MNDLRVLVRKARPAVLGIALFLSAGCGGGGGAGGAAPDAPAQRFAVTPAGTEVSIDPAVAQTVAIGGTQAFVVTAPPHRAVSAAVTGTCPGGAWSGDTYTTGPVTADCTVEFASVPVSWLATPSTDSGIAATPAGSQTVLDGEPATFSLAAGVGHAIVRAVGGDCPAGAWTGDVYETGPITAACTVEFTSVPLVFVVTPSAIDATVAPDAPMTAAFGSTPAFVVTPAPNHVLSASVAGTCPRGSWTGDTYTTGPITTDCTIEFAGVPVSWAVTASTAAGVSAAPAGSQAVAHGSSASFTVAAELGHLISRTVGGDCPLGAWTGDVYATGAITSDCAVAFDAVSLFAVTASASGVTVDPGGTQFVASGGVQAFTVTPPPYHLVSGTVAGTCPAGAWTGDTYTTGPVTADCTVAFARGCEHCGGTCVSTTPPPAFLFAEANGEVCTRPCAIQASVTPACGTCASACGLGESCVNGGCRCLAGAPTCRPTRQLPTCPVEGRNQTITYGCKFLPKDTSGVTMQYGVVEVNGAADSDIWIYVDGRGLFPAGDGDGVYYPYVMSCQEGAGKLYYPNSEEQELHYDGNGVITDLANLGAFTTTTKKCQPFDWGPVYQLFSSSVFDHGYYVKFRPDPGESGYAYQVMTVGFVDAMNANTTLLLVDYVINVLPAAAAGVTVTSAAYGGLQVTPSGPQALPLGATPSFIVPGGAPVQVGGTCPRGAWFGSEYFIQTPLAASCTVEFRPQIAVAVSHSPDVTVTPAVGSATVPHGGTLTFAVTGPADSPIVAGGTCPRGSLFLGFYTTGPITAPCTLDLQHACAGADSCGAMIDANLVTSAHSEYYGGPGGVPFGDDRCPWGHALVGFSGRHAGNIGRLQAECASVVRYASGGVTTVRVGSSPLLFHDAHGADTSSPTFELLCPAGSVVTRVDGYADAAAPNGSVTAGLHQLSLYCSALSWSGTVSVAPAAHAGTVLSSWSMDGSQPFSFACPDHAAVAAFGGREGSWIDGVALTCSSFVQ